MAEASKWVLFAKCEGKKVWQRMADSPFSVMREVQFTCTSLFCPYPPQDEILLIRFSIQEALTSAYFVGMQR